MIVWDFRNPVVWIHCHPTIGTNILRKRQPVNHPPRPDRSSKLCHLPPSKRMFASFSSDQSNRLPQSILTSLCLLSHGSSRKADEGTIDELRDKQKRRTRRARGLKMSEGARGQEKRGQETRGRTKRRAVQINIKYSPNISFATAFYLLVFVYIVVIDFCLTRVSTASNDCANTLACRQTNSTATSSYNRAIPSLKNWPRSFRSWKRRSLKCPQYLLDGRPSSCWRRLEPRRCWNVQFWWSRNFII